MPIEHIAPPDTSRLRNPDRVGNRSYSNFIEEARKAGGGWVSLPLDEVTGNTPQVKQAILRSSCKSRGLKIQTCVQAGRIFVRSVPDLPSA
jgi:hypothetical protein